MTTRVQVEKLRRGTDARGQVFEPLDAAGLAGQRNVHVVLTAPGHVRGNHDARGDPLSADRGIVYA